MSNKPQNKSHKLFSIYYENDGFNIKGDKLMGRQSAGWSFLKSIILSKRYKSLGVYLKNKKQKQLLIDDIKSILTKDNETIDLKSFPYMEPDLTAEFGGIQLPGPNIIDYANHRSFFGHEKYSLCGITHTTASYDVMNSFSALLTEPVMPWDAIICTSQSVLNTANKIIDIKKEFLKKRLGYSQTIIPKLPIIPLGINIDEFDFTDKFKNDSRVKLNIKDNDIVVAYVGRLSFHAKAHHLPMYIALENIAQNLKNDQKIHLIQTGWFASDFIKNSFIEDSKTVCPSVNCIFLDGRDISNKNITLASADIFMSLSDNIQETFGLTPLEAMACGVPVIVSDWDGYRSTVRDQKDGFRIPTYALGEGFGEDLMFNYMMGLIDYDNYIGGTVHKVAVDINKCIQKLTLLIEDSDLRKQLGENGKKRAKDKFSWHVILDQYEELYEELNSIRIKKYEKYINLEKKSLPSNRLDPFMLFSDYPTELISDKTKFNLSDTINNIEPNKILDFNSIKYTDQIPNKDELLKVFKLLKENKVTFIKEIIKDTKIDRDKVFNIMIFLLKYGYIYIAGEKNE